jgi:hypothetical protein
MKSSKVKVYIPRDETLFSWDPENMDKYWSQCKEYDSHPLAGLFINETAAIESRSVQLFSQFKTK